MLNQSTLRCIIILSILVVINFDLHILNYASTAKLCLKMKAVSDGVKADLNEAITQAARQDIKALPSSVTDTAVAVQTTEALFYLLWSQTGFKQSRTDSGVRSMRITLDPVTMLHRPLVWYSVCVLVSSIACSLVFEF